MITLKPASLFFILILLIPGVKAVRSRRGCYDDYAMSCEVDKVPLEKIDFDLEEACYRIEHEVLQDEYVIYYKQNLHPEYLNGIEFRDGFCKPMQQAYSHCAFCAGYIEQQRCKKISNFTRCGNMPTRQELLDKGLNGFRSEEDIDRVCDQLQNLANKKELPVEERYPRTKNLCQRQKLAKHLCPGVCDGGCFDAETHVPSCDGNTTSDDRLRWRETCDMLRLEAFNFMSVDQVFENMHKLEYLQAISKDHPNCTDFRQAYHHCFWCSDPEELCFHESKPATCERQIDSVAVAPLAKDSLESATTAEFPKFQAMNIGCRQIYESLQYLPQIELIYDVSKHTQYLFMLQNTAECNLARQAYPWCIWCDESVNELPCLTKDTCFIEAEVPPKYTQQITDKFGGPGTTQDSMCTNIFDYSVDKRVEPYTTNKCFLDIAATRLCPDYLCPEVASARERFQDYLGATNESEKLALIWASRSSAILSFFGACFILYDILTNPKSRKTVYHQLLIGMAIFDMITAFAWCFATAPIDKDNFDASHVQGASGNEATCKAQAFFIQLGFTSVYYNVSLAIYYVLVIGHGWKEFQLKKIRLYMHLLPVAVGIGLALGAIPVYHWIDYGCHIEPISLVDKDEGGELWVVLVFVVLPLGLSILAITGSMGLVYNSVRKNSAASQKWSFGISKASKLEQAVFWQCLFYVLAFYITWPLVFCVYLSSVDASGPLALTMTVAFVAPLQGFSNFLVYIRPKLTNRTPQRRQSRNTSSSPFFSRIREWSTRSRPFSRTSASGSLRGLDPSAMIAFRNTGPHRQLSTPAIGMSAVNESGEPTPASQMEGSEDEQNAPAVKDIGLKDADSPATESQAMGNSTGAAPSLAVAEDPNTAATDLKGGKPKECDC